MELVRQGFYTTLKWIDKTEDHSKLFVFLGLKESGKTTAIKNIFGNFTKRNKSSVSPNDALGSQITSPDKTVTILDVRSLPNKADENAKLLASLQKYLKCKTFVPTMVFITARLTDEDIVDESSEFKMALKSFSLLKEELTDMSCSNVVLLLTFGDKLSNESERFEKVEKYKGAFVDVLGTVPFAIIIDNTPLLDTRRILQTDKKLNCFQGLFLDYLNSLPQSRIGYIGMKFARTLTDYEAQVLKSDYNHADHFEILQALNASNGSVKEPLTPEPHNTPLYDLDSCATAFIPADCLTASSFGEDNRYSPDINPDNVYNLVPQSASILLENGEYLRIHECVVGQKLFPVNGVKSVVTKIIPIYGNDIGRTKGPIQFGSVFMKASIGSHKIQKFKNGDYYFSELGLGLMIERFFIMSYFYIEVNGGNYPFVVDKHICFSYCKKEQDPGVDNVTSDK